jgi:capsular polysaccharide transport system permease protein
MRNEAGILTVDSASTSLSSLSTQLEGELIALENDYAANQDKISDQAPQMRVMASQIDAKRRQLDALRAQLASTDSTQTNLAGRSTEFAQIELEMKLAENRLATSITALEQLQAMSQQKLLYLDPFLQPTMADEARRRLLWIGIVLAVSLVVFAGLAAMLSVVRSRLD